MHLLAAEPGAINDGSHAVDLGQTPGDIIVLSAADTELSAIAQARAKLNGEDFPSLRLASLLHLGNVHSVDHYGEDIIAHAKIVIVRLLGGRGYWPHGTDTITRICREQNIPVAFLPGDDQPDPELAALSTISAEAQHRLWQYGVHGGPDNALDFLNFAASLIGVETDWREPRPLVRAGLYWPGLEFPDLNAVKTAWKKDAPTAALVFYRALVHLARLRRPHRGRAIAQEQRR